MVFVFQFANYSFSTSGLALFHPALCLLLFGIGSIRHTAGRWHLAATHPPTEEKGQIRDHCPKELCLNSTHEMPAKLKPASFIHIQWISHESTSAINQ